MKCRLWAGVILVATGGGLAAFGCGGGGPPPGSRESIGAHGGKQDLPPQPRVPKKPAEEEKLPAQFRK